ncbi:MAG: class B sortase [Eubacterium sp.]|nr:class B sortase [Eubacterium sp.]
MKNKKTANKILFIIAAVVFISAAVYLAVFFYNQYTAGREYDNIPTKPTEAYEPLAYNPIDFDTLMNGNDEIYAWIKIDDTKVDYPIAQHSAEDNTFYLTHSAMDKSYLKSGAIYTEACNKKDFSDPVTLIYGHNNYGDSMFTTLHKFEDKDFFDKHEFVYIYTPTKKLTYKIISAFKYDDRHIMNTNDFSDKHTLNEFQQMLLNPESNNKNIRENLEEINENSKIIVLSTCITGDKESRYLVCGLLVNEEKTD